MSQKLTRQAAAEFSFFLAVPTMFAASVKSVYDVTKVGTVHFDSHSLIVLLIGSIVSFIIAMLSIKFLIGVVKANGFKIFGYYRILLGILVIILFKMGMMN
jgi:undecaprenyl-diphosphatase